MSRTRPAGAQSLAPILRWAGGKRWLVPTLTQLISGLNFAQYHEPFLGGASVYLGLAPHGRAYLRDLNSELIETYETIRDDPEGVADDLRRHVNTEEHYYRVRSRVPRSRRGRAARFIYLNHTSFNGIYRVNLSGVYNVPYGRRPTPNFPTPQQLWDAAALLATATLDAGDFADCLRNIRANDLIFIDPPYTVAHNDNGFVKYNQRLFSFEDQERLSELVDLVKARRAHYVLTNAVHKSILRLFDKGDRVFSVTRKNSVGGRQAVRGISMEYVFTNIPEHD